MQSKKFRQWSIRILSVLILCATTQVASAYEPPIGIPDPGLNWGSLHPIDTPSPDLPANWNSEVPGFYYFDPSHPNATDDNNTYGHPDKPRKRLGGFNNSFPIVYPAGSVVILGGTFAEPFNSKDMYRTVTFDCTEQEPCWLRGIDQQNMPSIAHGQIDLVGSSWLFVENLDFNGGHQRAIGVIQDPDNGNDSHHISIRNNVVRNHEWIQNTQGISTSGGAHEIVLYSNLFHDLGFDYEGTAADPDFQGFNPVGGYNQWFLNNTCYRISGDCVQLNAGNNGNNPDDVDKLHHIYIGKNTAWQNRQGGAWVKEAKDVVISQNVTHGMNGGGPGNSGHCYGGQYAKERVWFLFNECYDSVFGFRQSRTDSNVPISEVYYIGNVVYDIRVEPGKTNKSPDNDAWQPGAAFALLHGQLDRYIVDNTVYSVLDGVDAIFDSPVNISGNIIAGIGEQEDHRFFRMDHPGRNNNVTLDYNLFFDENRESYRSWQKKNGTSEAGNMSSLDSVRERTTYCQESCVFSDPLFMNASINPQSRDFRLQAGSPAIGANIKHAAYDRFEALYGLNIYKDFNGNDRDPINPSLGAFEYVDEINAFEPDKLQVKINYPTKKPVYTPNADATEIQFGGHVSYEDETMTVEWVLAQCASDCTEERANGEATTGANTIAGKVGTWRDADSTQKNNNWHVSNQSLFPGKNILIVNGVHPNGQKKVTSLIIESQVPLEVDEQAPEIVVSSPTATNGEIVRSNPDAFTLSGNASDNVALNSMTWSCISGCNGNGTINIDEGSTGSSWQFELDDLPYGLNRVQLTADDTTGNTTSLIVSIKVIDAEAPSAEIQQAVLSLSGSVSDNIKVESVDLWCVSVCVGSGRATLSGNTWTINGFILNPGSNLIRLKASDAAGNTSRRDYEVTH